MNRDNKDDPSTAAPALQMPAGTPPRGSRALQMHASEPANEAVIDAEELVIDEIDVDFDDVDDLPVMPGCAEPDGDYDEIILDLRSPEMQDAWYA
jgi:hypothetical protein